MEVVKMREYEDDDLYVKTCFTNHTFQLDSVIELVKQFESDTVKMLVCHCNTFNENDNELYRRYTTAEEINNFVNEPSPYATFSIDFGSRDTAQYLFGLVTGINLKYYKYIVNKKKRRK